MRRYPVVFSVILLAAGGVHADTIHVPGDQPTLGAAVEAASPGDEILVAPGLYVESITTRPRHLTIRGTGGAEATVWQSAGGSALRIEGEPGSGTLVVEGLTIRGGTGSPVAVGLQTLVVGGGIVVDVGPFAFSSDPALVLRDCVVRDNTARDEGGGLWASWVVLVEDCLFTRNRTQGDGGALWLSTLAGGSRVAHSELRSNHAGGNGGGYVVALGTQVVDCIVADNEALGDGGGGYEDTGAGWVGPERVRFLDNRAGGAGGGLAVRRQIGISCCEVDTFDLAFVGNEAGGDGGGLFLESLVAGAASISINQVAVDGLLAVGNVAGGVGGGVAALVETPDSSLITAPGRFELVGGTFVDNMAAGGGDALDVVAEETILTESIVWQGGAAVLGASPPDVSFSQVLGGWPGTGNDGADPLFVDATAGDLRLRGGSPCIDSGDPLAPTDADGSPSDRGALPFEPWIDAGPGLAGALGEPLLEGTGLNATLAPTTLSVSRAPTFSPLVLVFGFSELGAPLKGGVLVPATDWLLPDLQTDASGRFDLEGLWSPLQAPDSKVWVQAWLPDPTGPFGWTASNAVLATTR